jgi:hypothetical protein
VKPGQLVFETEQVKAVQAKLPKEEGEPSG